MGYRSCTIMLVLMAAAAFTPLPVPSAVAPTDLGFIIQHLADRSETLGRTKVRYRHTRLSTDILAWSSLRDHLLASHLSAHEDPRPWVESWIAATPTAVRECWDAETATGTSATGVRLSRTRRNRVAEFDTVFQSLDAIAQGVAVNRPPVEQILWAAGEMRVTVNDRRWVIQSVSPAQNFPLIALDPTLGPWHDALANPTIPGQSLVGEVDGSRYSLVYGSTLTGGTHSSARYEFDQERGWSPLRVVMAEDGLIKEDRIYAYQDNELASIRPIVIAHMEEKNSQAIISIFIVESWIEATVNNDFALRIPPMRFETLIDINLQSTGHFVLPAYLSEVEPSQRLQVAVMYIFDHWGTNTDDADFTADGIVDAQDLQYVASIF